MHRLLDLAYLAALASLSPWLLWRAWRTRRYRRGLWDTLLGLRRPPPHRDVAWFHGVSLGEVKLLRPVIEAFRRRRPEVPCVVSSTTDTGIDEAKKLYPDLLVFSFPFDF